LSVADGPAERCRALVGVAAGQRLIAGVDAAFAAFVPPLGIQTRDVAEAIVRVNARHPEKPLLAVLMGRQGLPSGLEQLHDASVPGYIFPESAARALGAMWRYRQLQMDPEGQPVAFDVDDATVAGILDAVAAEGGGKVSEPEAMRILEAYGVPVAAWEFVEVGGVGEMGGVEARAGAAAARIGFPVALKIVDPAITHKTDVGGVALNLGTEQDVRAAAKRILETVAARQRGSDAPPPGRPAARPASGLLVQRMAPGGRETIVGLTRVPRVGPLVMFGLGGVYVEVLRDVQFRLAPLLDIDAHRMIRDVRMYPLLEGVRGEPPCDRGALEAILLRVSQLAMRHPRIAEMDINPLLSLAEGAVAVDARFQVEETP